MITPYVSILTPCYNGETFVGRFLESVLAQTYKCIEVVIVDDGSTDRTREVIESYQEEFEKQGMKLVYQYQKNAGQAVAINKALQVMTGEYLSWMDSDDVLKKDSVEKRLYPLIEKGEGYFSISQCEMVDETDLNKVIRVLSRQKPKGEDTYFIDMILEQNVVGSSGGGFLVRTSDFLKACPKNQIHPGREGQNFQMMLPIIYCCKCIYVDEPLYQWVIRKDSHSNSKRTFKQQIVRWNNYSIIIKETLKSMNIKEYEELQIVIDKKYAKLIMNLSNSVGNKEQLEKTYLEFKEKYGEDEELAQIYKEGFDLRKCFEKKVIKTIKENEVLRKVLKRN